MAGSFEVREQAFKRIIGGDPKIEHLATGFGFTEGPVWRGDHLLFSDIPSNRIVKYQMGEEGPSVTTFRYPSGNTNGHTLDREGNLVSCEHANRRVTRTDAYGNIIVLANRYMGKRLNSPNDVVVKSDGSIYFTDPPYGLPHQTQGKELDFQGVYRISADGKKLTLLVDDFDRPNGLAFSPDESKMYIADTVRGHLRVFDVQADGSLASGRVFAEMKADEPGVPDGMRVDVDGNIYATGPGGVWVFSPGGAVLGRILMPEVTANCAWGDLDNRTLYMTATTGVYSVRLCIPGVRTGPGAA